MQTLIVSFDKSLIFQTIKKIDGLLCVAKLFMNIMSKTYLASNTQCLLIDLWESSILFVTADKRHCLTVIYFIICQQQIFSFKYELYRGICMHLM